MPTRTHPSVTQRFNAIRLVPAAVIAALAGSAGAQTNGLEASQVPEIVGGYVPTLDSYVPASGSLYIPAHGGSSARTIAFASLDTYTPVFSWPDTSTVITPGSTGGETAAIAHSTLDWYGREQAAIGLSVLHEEPNFELTLRSHILAAIDAVFTNGVSNQDDSAATQKLTQEIIAIYDAVEEPMPTDAVMVEYLKRAGVYDDASGEGCFIGDVDGGSHELFHTPAGWWPSQPSWRLSTTALIQDSAFPAGFDGSGVNHVAGDFNNDNQITAADITTFKTNTTNASGPCGTAFSSWTDADFAAQYVRNVLAGGGEVSVNNGVEGVRIDELTQAVADFLSDGYMAPSMSELRSALDGFPEFDGELSHTPILPDSYEHDYSRIWRSFAPAGDARWEDKNGNAQTSMPFGSDSMLRSGLMLPGDGSFAIPTSGPDDPNVVGQRLEGGFSGSFELACQVDSSGCSILDAMGPICNNLAGSSLSDDTDGIPGLDWIVSSYLGTVASDVRQTFLFYPDGPGRPIDKRTGEKIENVVDISIPLTNDQGGYIFRRMYRSGLDGGTEPAPFVGNRWSIPGHAMISLDGTGYTATSQLPGTSGSIPSLSLAAGNTLSLVRDSGFLPIRMVLDGSDYVFDVAGSSLGVFDAAVEQVYVDGEMRDVAVWRYTSQKGSEVLFYRPRLTSAPSGIMPTNENDAYVVTTEMIGQIAAIRDAYDHQQRFAYISVPAGHTSSAHRTLPSRIIFEGPADGMGDRDRFAEIRFGWDLRAFLNYTVGGTTTTFLNENVGKLRWAEAVRADEPSNWFVAETDGVVTHRVEYTYADRFDPGMHVAGTTSFNAELGSPGDLIMVRSLMLVDGSTLMLDRDYHETITQYRYHRDDRDETTDTDGDGLVENGHDHALKMVINPQQIQYLAEDFNAADLMEAAQQLLKTGDGTAVPHATGGSAGPTPIQLASKIVTQYGESPFEDVSGPAVPDVVKEQIIQSGCGCAGGGDQVVFTYDYFAGSGAPSFDLTAKGWFSIHVTESHTPGGSSTPEPYRATYYDYVYYGLDGFFGGASLLTHAATSVKDVRAGGSGLTWTTAKIYDDVEGARRLIATVSPAAIDQSGSEEYTPATATTSADYNFASTGRVDAMLYNAENRVVSTWVSSSGTGGIVSTVATRSSLPGNFDQVTSTTYDTTNPWDATSRTLFVEAGSGDANKQEVASFEYAYHDDLNGQADHAWVAITTEAESATAPNENGPGGSNYTYQYFDTNGRVQYDIDAAGVVTKYEHDDDTGQVTTITRNYQGTLPAYPSGFSAPDPSTIAHGAAVSDVFVTTIERDLLGRPIKTTSPSGQVSRVIRQVARPGTNLAWSQRTNAAYLVETTLPHKQSTTATLAGSAFRTWRDAGGNAIGTEELEPTSVPTADASYTRFHGTFAPTPLARSSVEHSVNGLVERSLVWPDTSVYLGTDTANPMGPYVTKYQHDDFGRVVQVTDPTDSRTVRAFDVLDRIVAEEIGIVGEVTRLVRSIEYDEGGVGNGLVTRVVREADNARTEASGRLVAASGDRMTEMLYDGRDRLRHTIRPMRPHQWVDYDNLDRPTVQIVHTVDSPTGITSAPVEADRLRVTETAYAQSGRVYRTRTAIDPTATSYTYFETDRWYDGAGRPIASLSPSGPMRVTSYDRLGRTVESYSVARSGDASSYTHGQLYVSGVAAPRSGDTVLTKTQMTYISASSSHAYGRPSLTTALQRLPGDTATSTRTVMNSIATFSASVYDFAGRPVERVNFGTNDSGDQYKPRAALTDGDLVNTDGTFKTAANTTIASTSETVYDARGLVEATIAPDGTRTRFRYDSLRRRVAIAENATAAIDLFGVELSGGDFVRYAPGSGANTGDAATDRITTFTYDGAGNQTDRYAYDATNTSSFQHTRYVYGVNDSQPALHGSLSTVIDSNRILYQVQYPDEGTGLTNSGAAYTETMAYNAFGEVIARKDQNKTVREYRYDDLGRVERDVAAAFDAMAADIDQTARAIRTEYDDAGRVLRVTTYDDPDSTLTADILNQIEYDYDELWRTSEYRMNPLGDVDTSDVETGIVTFDYADLAAGGTPTGDLGIANTTRLTGMTYPLANTTGATAGYATSVAMGFGAAAGTNDALSRLESMAIRPGTEDGTQTDQDIDYEYLGMGTVVRQRYVDAGLALDFIDSSEYGATPTSNRIHGFDRFGRVHRLVWKPWSSGSSTPHNIATTAGGFAVLEYTYDTAWNPTARLDMRHRGASATADVGVNRDEVWGYDGLDRLATADRGETNGYTTSNSMNVGATLAASTDGTRTDWTDRTWGLDTFGNWSDFEIDEDNDGTLDVDQTRTHNQANEVTNVSTTGGFTHDAAGNLIEMPTDVSTTTKQLVWDAWNRLVAVNLLVDPGGGAPIETQQRTTYSYYGMHQRATKHADTDQDTSFTPDTLERYYYDPSWRLLEQRIDTDRTTSDWDSRAVEYASSKTVQKVWGQRYIDELIAVQHVTNYDPATADDAGDTGPAFAPPRYALTDRNFSVIGLGFEGGGKPDTHRMRYSPYGASESVLNIDPTGDGTSDVSDMLRILAQFDETHADAGYTPELDVNGDGAIDVSDFLEQQSGTGTSSSELGSALSNTVGYAGYVWDADADMYHVRHRWYMPEVGRWASRDPLGYVDGQSQYQYVRSSPISGLDYSGMFMEREQIWPLDPDYRDSDNALEDLLRRCYHRCRSTPKRDGSWPSLVEQSRCEALCRGKHLLPRIRDSKIPVQMCTRPLLMNTSNPVSLVARACVNVCTMGRAHAGLRTPDGITYTWVRRSAPGGPPRQDRDDPLVCWDCYRSFHGNRTLQYGRGAGKDIGNATDEEIIDCISNVTSGPYNLITNNCHSWTKRAMTRCGFRCKVSPFDGAGEPFEGHIYPLYPGEDPTDSFR